MYQKNWGAEEECYICTEGTAVHWKYYFFSFFLDLAPVP